MVPTYRSYQRRAFARERCTCAVSASTLPGHAPAAGAGQTGDGVAAPGQDPPVLRSCTSCQACNQFCPEDCRPANLVLDRWHDGIRDGKGCRCAPPTFCPTAVPAFEVTSSPNSRLTNGQTVSRWRRDEPGPRVPLQRLQPDHHALPDLLAHLRGDGDSGRAGLLLRRDDFPHGTLRDAGEVARRLSHWFRQLGAERVYLVCTAGLNMLRNVLPQFGAELDGIEFLPYLQVILERLEAGDTGPGPPPGHDGHRSGLLPRPACWNRALPACPGGVLAAMGVEVRRRRTAERAVLCCGIGGGFSHASAYHPADLLLSARATSRDQRHSPADATCVYCSGCLEMMSVARFADPNRRPVYPPAGAGATGHRRDATPPPGSPGRGSSCWAAYAASSPVC